MFPSGSSGCTLVVAWFVLVSLIRPVTPLQSPGSYWFVGFVRVRIGGRWVRFGSSGLSVMGLSGFV